MHVSRLIRRSLVISTSLGTPRNRNFNACNEIIALFPDLNKVLIELSPLNACLDSCESRLQDLKKGLERSLGNRATTSVSETSPTASTLWISGMRETRQGAGNGLEIRVLQLLLPQIHLPLLRRLVAQLVSPISPSDWLSTAQTHSRFSIPSLQELEIEFRAVVSQGATSLDLCVSTLGITPLYLLNWNYAPVGSRAPFANILFAKFGPAHHQVGHQDHCRCACCIRRDFTMAQRPRRGLAGRDRLLAPDRASSAGRPDGLLAWRNPDTRTTTRFAGRSKRETAQPRIPDNQR